MSSTMSKKARRRAENESLKSQQIDNDTLGESEEFSDPEEVTQTPGRNASVIRWIANTIQRVKDSERGGEREDSGRESKRSRKAAQRRSRPGKGDIPDMPKSALAMKATVGNLVMTEREVFAWFVLRPRATSFRPKVDRERDIHQDALAFSKLVGRRCYLRTSFRPYSVRQWAESTYRDATENGAPLEGFADMLVREQRHMELMDFSEKWAYVGVRVTTFRKHPKDALAEAAELRHVVDEIEAALANSHLRAEPATTSDMEWLLRRSVGLGLAFNDVNVLQDYAPENIESLESHAQWTAEPMSGEIIVSGDVLDRGQRQTRHVAILTLGRLSDQAIPEEQDTGWIQRTDKLPFPIEWCVTFDVENDEKTRRYLQGRLDVIKDQMEHYISDHGMEPPRRLAKQDNMAKQIQDELSSDHGGSELRTQGWYRLAVSASTREELLERIAKVKALYAHKADFVRPANQYRLAREFIPGEPLSTPAFRRRMSLTALAASIPQGTSEVGDLQGITLGYTAGSGLRAVAWDAFHDMERGDKSGLCIIAGGLGSGKSFAFGSAIYKLVMGGARAEILDPSDRLGRLCELPELRDHARYVNLVKGKSGELGPYRVVATPPREFFDSEEEWAAEVEYARATRKTLMRDILDDFLPPAMRHDKHTSSVLTRALSAVEPEQTSTARDVLDAIEAIADGKTEGDLNEEYRITARDILIELSQLADTPMGRLIFPPKDAPRPSLDDLTKTDRKTRLTVYTLNGISLPDEKTIERDRDKTATRLSLAVLGLAAHLVQSSIWLGDRAERKVLGIDEGKILSSISAGQALITKGSTDSRKFNIRFLLCSQNVTHFDVSDSENSLSNLVGAALIGSTDGKAEIDAALRVMKIKPGQGYEHVISSLRVSDDSRPSQRDQNKDEMTEQEKAREAIKQRRNFVFFDGRGHEVIVIDTDAHPELIQALNSKPRADVDALDVREQIEGLQGDQRAAHESDPEATGSSAEGEL